jgi:hypothetical protein
MLRACAHHQADIPVLHKRLRAVGEPERLAMRRRLACATQHMAWSTVTGAFMQVRAHQQGQRQA